MTHETKKQIDFPEGFLWGAATSSHQVEGNNHNDWTVWEKSKKRIKSLESTDRVKKYGLDNYISGRAADHYNLFKEDFRIAKDLGHTAHRFSIEWSRIEPEEGVFDEKEIEHYKHVLASLRELGIEPFVTLWHWTIPIWLAEKGGWASRKTPGYFARYAAKMSEAFGQDVKFWITVNEPEIYAINSYYHGTWPPQQKNVFEYVTVFHNLIRGHRRAYEIIKKTNPLAQVGIAKNNICYEAQQNKLVNRVLKYFVDWGWNFYFLNRIRSHQDFIGLNHYFHNRINFGFNKNENKIVSDIGWELYPEAIRQVLVDLKRYNKPIYITENGLADVKDTHRAWFIYGSLKSVKQAIDEGVDVRGYLHWSLLDNFEWDSGYWPRFGLVEINYQTLERRIRPSAEFYRDVCLNNKITEEMIGKYKLVL